MLGLRNPFAKRKPTRREKAETASALGVPTQDVGAVRKHAQHTIHGRLLGYVEKRRPDDAARITEKLASAQLAALSGEGYR